MNWLEVTLVLSIGSAPPTGPAGGRVGSSVAGAPDDDAEVHRLAAIEAYQAGDLETALREFQAAKAVDPDPAYTFNIGRVYEEMGELALALEHYEEFVLAPRVSLEEREAAQARADRIRKILPARDAPGPDPEPEPTVDETTEDDPAEAVPTSDKPHRALIVSGASLLAAGAVVAIGGGVGFGIAGRRIADDVEAVANGNPDGLTLTEVEDLDARGRTANLWQIVTASAGGVLAITGAALLGVGLHRRSAHGDQVRVTPTGAVWSAGAAVGLRGRF